MKAFRNLCRTPLRSLVFFAVYLVLSLLLILMIVTKNVASENIDGKIGPLGSCVKVSLPEGDGKRIGLNTLTKLDEAFGVIENYHAEASLLCDLPALIYVRAKNDAAGGFSNYGMASLPFKLHAVTSTDIAREFYSGERIIVSGHGISRADSDGKKLSVVVSETVAELNSLTVGDPVKIILGTDGATNEISMTVYIGGIYRDTVKRASNSAFSYALPENEVYLPMSVYHHLRSEENIPLDAAYLDIGGHFGKTLDSLKERLSESPYYDLILTPFTPESEAEALSKLTSALDVAITAVMISFSVSLFGVLFWNLQSRMREIGTYCALGVKRRDISLLFTRETLILFLTSFILASSFLTVLFFSLGEDVFSIIFSSANDSVEYETTIDTVMYSVTAEKSASDIFASPLTVFVRYFLGAAGTSLALSMTVIALVYAVSRVMISRLDVMNVMGGRGA